MVEQPATEGSSTQAVIQLVSPTSTRSDRRAGKTTELLERAAASALDERERLYGEVVELNLCVAESVARRYARRGEPLDDLVQVACVGLTKAVRKFDPDRGHDFLSYAVPTMSGEVKRYFRDCGWSVRPPRRIQELQARISSTASELNQQLRRSPRPSELAEALDVDPVDISEALASDGCFSPASLDERGPHDDGYSLAEHLGAAEPGFERAEAIAMLRPLCQQLKPRDKQILYLRFYNGWTQAQIAAELGVTQMQVSRLLQRILSSMRSDLESAPSPQGAARTSPPVASRAASRADCLRASRAAAPGRRTTATPPVFH